MSPLDVYLKGCLVGITSQSLDAVTFDILTACLKNFFSVPSV